MKANTDVRPKDMRNENVLSDCTGRGLLTVERQKQQPHRVQVL